MRILLVILMAAPLLAGDGLDILPEDGEKQGRLGNELYGQQSYDLAAEAYAEGLAELGEGASTQIRYALENNLGAALLKAGDVAGSREAFGRALAVTTAPSDAARTSYNAGNAAFAGKDLAKAVEMYRQSLLQDPTNMDAKFNYEFAKRQLENQQEQQQQQGSNQQNQDQKQQQDGQGEQDEGDPQQQEQQQQQQQGGQNQQQESEPEQSEEQQSSSSAQETPTELSEEQAQRILQALQNEEEQLLREVQRPKSRPRRVEKDW